MIWKAFISFNDSCLLFRSSIELLTPRLSPWVSCTEDLILCRTSGQTVTIYSFPLRFFLPSRDPSIFLEKLRFLCLDTFKLAYKPWLPFVFASDFSVSGRDWNTPFRAWYITSRCLNIGWNTPLLLAYYFSVFVYQMKHSFSCLRYYILVVGYLRRRDILRSVIGGEEATQPTDTPLACDFSQPI